MATQEEKEAFHEAIANMSLSASPYFKDYVFYLHLLAQCRVTFTTTMPAAAGVSFSNDHYTLWINPSPVIGYGGKEEGLEPALGFCADMPIQQRIGILKHEMLHIALGHLLRVGDRDYGKYNIASDTALNQDITRSHLPSYALYPDNFPAETKNILWGQTAEYYYELLENESSKEEQDAGDGKGDKASSSGNGKPNGKLIGNHEMWKESKGDPTLQQELTKTMVEKAGNEAIKATGNLPQNYGKMIENLSIHREVDWKQVLRAIVGNKRANIRRTLMRKDRRNPTANWIKGKTKNRVFELGVISDVSGSVSNEALLDLWGEIISICDLFKVQVKMVQIDVEPSPPVTLSKNTRLLERTRSGGTRLSPAIEEFRKNEINFNALVVTTDGFLADSDITPFKELGVPVVWLIDSAGVVMPEMDQGRMRAIKLKPAK